MTDTRITQQDPRMPSAKPPVDGQGAATSHLTRRGRLSGFGERYALVGLLLAVILFFSVHPETSATFLTPANFQVVLGTQGVLALIALGALLPLIANQWDLSVGAVAGLSAVSVAFLFSQSFPLWIVLMAALVAGLAVGLLNAVLVTKVGTSAVITTLGVAGVIAGAITQITGGKSQVANIPPAFRSFGSGSVLGLPYVFWVMLAIAGVVYYLLAHTPYGRYLYAFGSNPHAARLVGLKTSLLLASTFVFASVLSAAGGVLLVARAGGADPRVGESLTMSALAAAFLSAASIQPGRYNVGGMLVAMLLLAFLNSGLNLAGAPPFVSQYVNGAALVVGVALAVVIGRRKRTGSKR
jgi:ribose transport system permease protein